MDLAIHIHDPIIHEVLNVNASSDIDYVNSLTEGILCFLSQSLQWDEWNMFCYGNYWKIEKFPI